MREARQYLMTQCKDCTQAEETSKEGDVSPRPQLLGSLVKCLKLHYFHYKRIRSLDPSKRELMCLTYSDL